MRRGQQVKKTKVEARREKKGEGHLNGDYDPRQVGHDVSDEEMRVDRVAQTVQVPASQRQSEKRTMSEKRCDRVKKTKSKKKSMGNKSTFQETTDEKIGCQVTTGGTTIH